MLTNTFVHHLRDLPYILSIINKAAGIFLVKLRFSDSSFSPKCGANLVPIYSVLFSRYATSPPIVKTVLHLANSWKNYLPGNLSLLQNLSDFNGDVMIRTDQNFNYLDIETHSKTPDLYDIFIYSGFLPTMTLPTRITHNTSILIGW